MHVCLHTDTSPDFFWNDVEAVVVGACMLTYIHTNIHTYAHTGFFAGFFWKVIKAVTGGGRKSDSKRKKE
jgi:hypothetical protein